MRGDVGVVGGLGLGSFWMRLIEGGWREVDEESQRGGDGLFLLVVY